MRKKKDRLRKGPAVLLAMLVLLSCWMFVYLAPATGADDVTETTQLVEKSRMTLQSFAADENMKAFVDLAKKAKGILIVPQLLKAGFFLGGSGGSGVLLIRDRRTGPWHGPAFYTMGGVSFGLQFGGQAAEVLLLAMTDRGVRAFLSDSFKLGADAGVAVGPVGAGAQASTANLSADILCFSRAKGLYGGLTVDGSVIAVRDGWNRAFYGRPVTPTDILVHKGAGSSKADGLIGEITRVTR